MSLFCLWCYLVSDLSEVIPQPTRFFIWFSPPSRWRSESKGVGIWQLAKVNASYNIWLKKYDYKSVEPLSFNITHSFSGQLPVNLSFTEENYVQEILQEIKQ